MYVINYMLKWSHSSMTLFPNKTKQINKNNDNDNKEKINKDIFTSMVSEEFQDKSN